MSPAQNGLAGLIELAARIRKMEGQIKTLSLPSLGYSSLEDSAIPEFDRDGTQVAQYGTQFDGSHMAAPLVGPTPPVPSAPTAVAVPGGGVQVDWDGLWADPAAIVPMDFSRVEVHVSPVIGFDASTATWLRGTIETPRGGQLVVAPLLYVQHEVRLVARSLTGARSAASAAVLVTPTKVSGVDLATGSVGFDQIAFKQPGNLVQDGSFEDATWRAAAVATGTTGAATFSFVNDGTASLGSWFLRAAPGLTSTYRSIALTLPGSTSSASPVAGYIPCQPGERYLLRMMARQSGANGSFNIGVRVIDKTGAAINTATVNYNQILATSVGAAFGLLSMALTIPANGAWMQPFLEARPDASAGTWDFDQVELRPIVGTALIDDAAITNAKIGALAVDDAKIGSVNAAKITTGELAAGQRVSAGPLNGTHAEMAFDGFHVYAEDLVDGVPNEAVRMGTAGNDFFAVLDADGLPVASIDQDGGAAFTGLDVLDEQTLFVGGNPFIGSSGGSDQWDDVLYTSSYRDFGLYPLGYMERFPRGPVTYAEIAGASLNALTGAGEVGWFEMRATLKPNRHYGLRISPFVCNYQSTGSCTYGIVARYTNNGTSPTLASTELLRTYQTAPTASGGFWMSFAMPYRRIFSTTSDVDFRILISVFAGSASNTTISAFSTQSIYGVIEDLGPVMDNSAVVRNITSGSPTPPAAPKQYTRTYYASSSATYRGDGTKRTDTADIVQGYNSFNGDGQGVVCFGVTTPWLSDLSGATVQKIEVYAYANSWYYNAGGTAKIKVHGYSTPPGSSPSQTTAVSSAKWPKPGGRWVTLPSSLYAGFKSGTYKGFGFGPAGTTDLEYYGRFNGEGQAYEPRIRITYTK